MEDKTFAFDVEETSALHMLIFLNYFMLIEKFYCCHSFALKKKRSLVSWSKIIIMFNLTKKDVVNTYRDFDFPRCK